MHFKQLNEKWRYYFIDVISALNGNMKEAPAIEFDKENILAMEKLKYVVFEKHFPFPGKIQTMVIVSTIEELNSPVWIPFGEPSLSFMFNYPSPVNFKLWKKGNFWLYFSPDCLFKGMTMRQLFRIPFNFVLGQPLYKAVTQHAINADPRYPSSAGCYRNISTTRCRQNSRTHAYKFVVKMIDAKASTGWSLSSSASLITEPRKPDLRLSFPTQTDFTTNVMGKEVKRKTVQNSL